MDKITHSSKNITPFGGLNFIYQAMKRMGLDKFLDEHIGSRSIYATYSLTRTLCILCLAMFFVRVITLRI